MPDRSRYACHPESFDPWIPFSEFTVSKPDVAEGAKGAKRSGIRP